MTRIAIALALLLGVARAGDAVHHDLVVRLEPKDHAIAILDRITGVAANQRFRLHAGLTVTPTDEAFRIEVLRTVEGPVPLKEYGLRGPAGKPAFLRLAGKIHHPLVAEEQEYARSFSRTPGIICDQGVVLSGSTYWIPHFEDRLLTFSLKVELPEGWDAVSQGRRTQHEKGRVTWECRHPMEEVYLIAARFVEYSRRAADVTAYAFLRAPDAGLASKYLETTAQYLEMYGDLIGPYPFEKFALVENFWETGYGMPSFTLLGPRIIRFPFILHSSYPHEILHNWWGNSVYVDWEGGNWCEGLTAYLADHLIKEGQGQGAAYRRDTLKKYRDYVRAEKDFPLADFRSRHSSATEAVGYGKSAMLFHMLRRRLGDAAFARALQRFYREFKFKQASFADLGRAFGAEAFVRQWVERPGAPVLEAALVDGELVVRQTQAEEPFDLYVPVLFTVAGKTQALLFSTPLAGREVRLPLPDNTRRIDVDPYFDVFRLLDRAEIPPTLGEVFGAEKVMLVLPREPEAWGPLAEAWRREGQVEVVQEQDLDALPQDRAVWILGTENVFRQQLEAYLAPRQAGMADGSVRVGAGLYPLEGHSFVFTAPHPVNPELAIGWIGCAVDRAIPGLARKLPHYGKYSYLAFSGEEPSNVAKGQWEVTDSPLVPLAEQPRAALPPREPLARLAPAFDAERLMGHVRFLAAERLRGRGVGTDELDEAAQYIADAFEKAGLVPAGMGGGWFQVWEEPGGPEGRPVKMVNVVGVLPGTKWPTQTVVVGAHYDHLGLGWPDVRQGNRGLVHNGADDNASGVAVLLELARILGGRHKPGRTIAFVAFTGEEWGRKGSRRYVRAQQRPAFAMVNLDTVGRLNGKKLTILGSGTASEWKHIAMGVGYTTGVEAVCVPQDPGGSDQVSFHEAGVPAVQIFSGPHADYHRPTDDVDKIDAAGLVKVATFVRETLVYLGDREGPLTSSLHKGGAKPPAGGSRRVSLGTMPDFAYPGPGVKVGAVLDGSPAAKAGIRKDDLLLAIDDVELTDLRAFSKELKSRKPGDVIRIRLRRGNEDLTLEAKLVAR